MLRLDSEGFPLHTEQECREDSHVTTFTSIKELDESVQYRARCVLGMRGIKESFAFPAYYNNTLNYYFVKNEGRITNAQLADAAKSLADETIYWGIP